MNSTYLRQVPEAYQAQAESNLHLITKAGKAVQQASSEALAAYQRLLDEPKAMRGNVEQWDALVTYNQQVLDCVTTLAIHIPTMNQRHLEIPQLQEFITSTDELLRHMEDAILAGRRPQHVERFAANMQHIQTILQSLITYRLNPRQYSRIKSSSHGQTLQACVPFMTVLNQIAQYTTHMYQTISNEA